MTRRRKRVGPTERLPLAEARQKYPVKVTERDTALVELLYWLRALITEQISRVLFPGNWSTCTQRLKKLFLHSYIWRYQIDLHQLGFKEGPRETLMHTLDEAGARVLAQQWGVPVETIWRPSDRKIAEQSSKHLILCNDIRIAIKLAAQQHGYSVTDWKTDYTRQRIAEEHKFVVTYLPPYEDASELETSEIIPDDSFTIVTPERRYSSIIELDTGSETRQPKKRPPGKDSSIAAKVRRYIELLHKPSPKEPSLYEKITGQDHKGIRVFFISTGTDLAIDGLLDCVRRNNGRNTYWAARHNLAKREDLVLTRPIWRKAGDDELAYYPWIGMSKLEEVRHRLRQYGVGANEIQARVNSIVNLAKSQVSEGWGERKYDMSLEQAVALRSDELAEAILRLFINQVAAQEEKEASSSLINTV